MDYMTLKEAAEKWGVTPRRVNYYCAGGRIPGAVKMAGVWLLPKTAEKPLDGRTKQGRLLKHEFIPCGLRLLCNTEVTYNYNNLSKS